MRYALFLVFVYSLPVFSARVEVPAEDILEAAQSIEIQRGPQYYYAGKIYCYHNFPMVGVRNLCLINVGHGLGPERVANSARIIKILRAKKMMTTSIFNGKYEAMIMLSHDAPAMQTKKAEILTLDEDFEDL